MRQKSPGPQKTRGFVIAGANSGAGKTTVTLGLLEALIKRGLKVQPFKAGPDFIDPVFHRAVVKCPSYNLDTWMMGPDGVKKSLALYSTGADIAVIEGVMGLFDGRDGLDERGSTGHLAKILKLPVLLIVNAEKTARSAAAIVKGFQEFDPDVEVRWVLFNRIKSQRHFKTLSDAVKANTKAAVIGYLPFDETLGLSSRHLGLTLQNEIKIAAWEGLLKRLSTAVASCVDIDLLLKTMPPAKKSRDKQEATPAAITPVTRIAVAMDRAFCFYYEENLDILRQAGAEIVFFSPIKDKKLPPRTSGIYLGGGYPELHAKRLSQNAAMRNEIKTAARSGMPIYAECGGLIYLSRSLRTVDNKKHAMTGIFPWQAKMLEKRKALGYREVRASDKCPFLKKGSMLKGHEFHYSEISGKADAARAYAFRCPDTGRNIREGFTTKNALASYVHAHFASNPEFAAGFIKQCLEFSAGKTLKAAGNEDTCNRRRGVHRIKRS